MRGCLGHLPTRRGLAVVVVVMLIGAGLPALLPAESSHAARRAAAVARARERAAPTRFSIVRPAATAVLVPHDPFKTAALRRFLRSRSGNVTAGVYDVNANATFLYHPGEREQTASIVKVDILATLLAQEQAEHEPPSGDDDGVATEMIEESDNDDAQALFNEEGGATALAAFDRRVGMTQTTPAWAWGLTETDPRDQLRLLRHIALPNRVLRYEYRHAELYLMEHVISEDYWGITAGPSSGVTVAVKNGWLPVADGWQINSIGMVRGHHRFYLIAVMTNGNATEGYGIDTIEGISALIYADLRQRPAPPAGSTGPSGVSGSTGPSASTGAS
jgi:hypothetical protein